MPRYGSECRIRPRHDEDGKRFSLLQHNALIGTASTFIVNSLLLRSLSSNCLPLPPFGPKAALTSTGTPQSYYGPPTEVVSSIVRSPKHEKA